VLQKKASATGRTVRAGGGMFTHMTAMVSDKRRAKLTFAKEAGNRENRSEVPPCKVRRQPTF